MREGYKKAVTGVIPTDWNTDKLNNLAKKITDGTHKTPKYTEDGIPFLRVTDIHNSTIDWNNVKYISKEEHTELIRRCKPEKGDILYSKNGTIGIPKIIDWDREFSVFVSLCLIKIKNEGNRIYPKYLEQYLKSDNCMEQIKLRAKQGTVTNLHLEEIRELEIPIPSLKEQQKIADILSTVDSQIEQTESLIQKTKELKKGLMQRLLTKGIGHTEFKETEVGVIPKEWEVKKIEDTTDTTSGGTPNRSKKEYYENGTIPWVKTGELNKKYIFNTEEKITEEAIKKSSAKLIPINSVLIAMYGATIGKTSIVRNEVSTNQACCAVICKEEQLDYEFLYYDLSFNKENLINMGVGAAQPNISQKIIKEFKIPVPNVKEQKRIADVLISIDKKIDEYDVKKENLQQLKQGLMQKLLTGKIRVISYNMGEFICY